MKKIIPFCSMFLMLSNTGARALPQYAASITNPGVVCAKCHDDGRTWVPPVIAPPPVTTPPVSPPPVTPPPVTPPPVIAPPKTSAVILPPEEPNAVYRFYNTQRHTHFYTANVAERNNVLERVPELSYEGVSFKVASAESSPSMAPVYRFYNSTTGTHFYTISQSEKDYVLANYRTFTFEGEAYNAYTTKVPGTVGLHRFLDSQTGTHFYTTSDAEKQKIQETAPAYQYEGIVYYVENAPAENRDLVVLATNDLGMHCACPGTEYFMLLPPFNTIRAQVIQRGQDPKVLGADDGIVVEYKMMENTDASLKNDPYYATWINNMPKYGFGPAVRPDGQVQGISGATLAGQLEPQKEGWWEIVGVPAYPDATNSVAADKIMTDPLGGPNRNPYLTAEIKVKDAVSGKLLTETKAVVPVAFGGCCSCHLKLTQDNNMEPTPANSFALMGSLHERDSGINFAKIDPDGDGQPGPIRCSACHLDPAMGETVSPGYKGFKTSKYTFSNVLHRWHAENAVVKKYDPNIATNCYACHPGNNVGCFRDFHADKGLWCTDCHGDLNQRAAEGQVDQPWSRVTLPKCADCHNDMGEGGGNLNVFGGEFLNSRGHVDQKVLCSSCHGSPHALYPSSVVKDNYQPITLQGSDIAIGKCDVCHTDQGSNWAMPPHELVGGGIGTGSVGTGGATAVNAATELKTTCLKCHSDKQSSVKCSNSKWTAHKGSRVSTAVYDAVTTQLTGGVCLPTTSSSSHKKI